MVWRALTWILVLGVVPARGRLLNATDKLACLCRGHHRLKTHGGWTYRRIRPGTYLWTSPLGYQYLRDPTGTTDVTPRPVEPPGAA